MSDKDNVVQQAQMWAQEARTQRETVLSILRYFGLPERDWEALSLIKAKLEAPDALLSLIAKGEQAPAAHPSKGGDADLWQLVPIFPTKAMLDAAEQKFATAKASIIGFSARELAYKAMLEAAPTPSTPPTAPALSAAPDGEARDAALTKESK